MRDLTADEILDHLAQNPAAREMIDYGREDGYPTCCIAHFMSEVAVGLNPSKERAKLGWRSDGSGYVPCPECLSKDRG